MLLAYLVLAGIGRGSHTVCRLGDNSLAQVLSSFCSGYVSLVLNCEGGMHILVSIGGKVKEGRPSLPHVNSGNLNVTLALPVYGFM